MVVDYVRVHQEPDTSERFVASFRDDVAGWVKVELPFDAFERADVQPEGALDDGFTPTEVWGLDVRIEGGAGSALLDELRWYRME
ncbi:MAG: hypothetical protein R6X23_13490 [Acidimicrobiia bacterium]